MGKEKAREYWNRKVLEHCRQGGEVINREEIDKIFLLTEWNDYKAALKAMQDLVGEILLDRDEALRWKEAYREVAHSLLWSDTITHPICVNGVVHTHVAACELGTIDAEAKRVFEDNRAVEAHLAFIDHELKRKE